jgi:hypothetical protein
MLYERWPKGLERTDGYSILIPTPGDLPVFAHLALAGLAHQDATDRHEIIVIPDQMTPEFGATVERASELFAPGTVRVAPIGRKGQALQRLSGEPYLNHFLQVFRGVEAARASHVVLHDVDLFINKPEFFRERYHECRNARLACLGVELAHDVDWYERHGVGPVLTTWELMFEVEWVRTFPPWQVHGHENSINGGTHVFDTMDYPQVRTPAERRRLREAPDEYVHFRWVITVFRHFQRASGQPYEDHRFRLLLIRILVDAFGGFHGRQLLPSVNELARGITDAGASVTYQSSEIEVRYASFRDMLRHLTDGPLIAAEGVEGIERALAPFDAAFA